MWERGSLPAIPAWKLLGLGSQFYCICASQTHGGRRESWGHHLGPHGLLKARRSWERLRKQARAPGSCDLLSEAKGEPRREGEGGATARQPEAPAGLTERWGKMGLTPGKQVGALTPWRRVGH